MSTRDKAANKVQDAKGKVKEAVGSAVGNRDLENKGKIDQGKAGLKDAVEDLKDAVEHAKDSIKRS